MHISHDPWIWIAAILTLAIFSFLYKDNPFFKMAEHIFVGVATGYGFVYTWNNGIYPNLLKPLFVEHQLLFIIPFILGLMYLSVIVPKFSYFIRWPFAFLLGVGSGLSIPLAFRASLVEQIKFTLLPNPHGITLGLFINALLIFIGVVTVVLYFYFSTPHEGIMKPISKTGIIFLMLGFGASFGYTVMARFSLLVGRFEFLLGKWLGLLSWLR